MTKQVPKPAADASARSVNNQTMPFPGLRRLLRAVAMLRLALDLGGSPMGLWRKASALYGRGGLAGLRAGFNKVATGSAADRCDYAEWLRRYGAIDAPARAALHAGAADLAAAPHISLLLPRDNAVPDLLDQTIWSVRRQLYPHWSLCIAACADASAASRQLLARHCAEEPRITTVYLPQQGQRSAAINTALTMARGEFVALLNQGDMLAEEALYWMAEALNRHPEAGLVYSDEDQVDAANRRFAPHFKPDLNYELLLAQNYIGHLTLYGTALVRGVGGLRSGFDGAEEHDLVLRIVERLAPAQVVHVARVLYHRRAAVHSDNLEGPAAAGRLAVAAHLARCGVAAEVLAAPEAPSKHRVRYAQPTPAPLVSIIIPTRDRADLLGMCLDTLVARSSYANYEVIIVDNGSVEAATQTLFARLPTPRVRILRHDQPFNFSALNNFAVRHANGSLVCLMNNDIEILTPDWLEEMVALAVRPDTGCVGARLWYPDGRLQHAGCVLGIGGVAGHAHKLLPRGDPGYFGRAVLHQSYSAVTAACLLVRRDVFEQVGGLDEELAIAFNDIDFCLRVRAAGYRNVWTPYAEMVHHESASRGNEDTPVKQARFAAEVAFIRRRWGAQFDSDPAYNVNLSGYFEDFSYAWPPRCQ